MPLDTKTLDSVQNAHHINLKDKQINDEGVIKLIPFLKKNPTIIELNLSQNQISDKGIRALVPIFQNSHTLTKLYLHANQIGDAGAENLSEILRSNCLLKELNLDRNRITDRGAKTLADALKRNNTLYKLSLYRNQITDIKAIAEEFARGAESNNTFTWLNLEGCDKWQKGFSKPKQEKPLYHWAVQESYPKLIISQLKRSFSQSLLPIFGSNNDIPPIQPLKSPLPLSQPSSVTEFSFLLAGDPLQNQKREYLWAQQEPLTTSSNSQTSTLNDAKSFSQATSQRPLTNIITTASQSLTEDPNRMSLDEEKIQQWEPQKLVLMEFKLLVELVQKYKAKKARKIRLNTLSKEHSNLRQHYDSLNRELEGIFFASTTAATGMVPIKSLSDLSIGVTGMRILSKVLGVIPFIGNTLGGVASGVSTGIELADIQRQTNALKNIASIIGNNKQSIKLACDVAEQLTERYHEQLLELPTPEQENQQEEKKASSLSEIKKTIKNTKDKIISEAATGLNIKSKSRAEELAEFAIYRMLIALLDVNGPINPNNSNLSLAEQLVHSVTQSLTGLRNLKNWAYESLGTTSITTQKNNTWILSEIYVKPGIKVNGKFYTGPGLEPETYGYRLGTEEEIKGLQEQINKIRQEQTVKAAQLIDSPPPETLAMLPVEISSPKQEADLEEQRISQEEINKQLMTDIEMLKAALDLEKTKRNQIKEQVEKLLKAQNQPSANYDIEAGDGQVYASTQTSLTSGNSHGTQQLAELAKFNERLVALDLPSSISNNPHATFAPNRKARAAPGSSVENGENPNYCSSTQVK
jgi:hypothetical protein